MAEDETPEPRLVQAPGDFVSPEGDEQRTASARARFVARPHDGIWSPADQPRSKPVGRREQVEAFKEYVERPDIESRESILARENALPAQFGERNVGSGAVDDGLVGTNGLGFGGEENEEAAEEAASIDNVSASTDGQ